MLKSKSFYVSIVSVLCAIAVVGITSMAINGKGGKTTEEEKSYLESDNGKDKEGKVDISGEISKEENGIAKENEAQDVIQNQTLVDNDIKSNEKSAKKEENNGMQSEDKLEEKENEVENKGENANDKGVTNKKETSSVNDAGDKKDGLTTKEVFAGSTLTFNEEKGLSWPIEGDVLMAFSEDDMVYYETLGQFMKSDKILIGAAVGDKVKASADGVVESVVTTRQTGQTVTMSIGSGYTVTYGELDNITVKKGDKVKTGQIIGTVATPSGYYSKEGTNVYFKVEENDKPVNPMYLLK